MSLETEKGITNWWRMGAPGLDSLRQEVELGKMHTPVPSERRGRQRPVIEALDHTQRKEGEKMAAMRGRKRGW
jgi:hypothetical protein